LIAIGLVSYGAFGLVVQVTTAFLPGPAMQPWKVSRIKERTLIAVYKVGGRVETAISTRPGQTKISLGVGLNVPGSLHYTNLANTVYQILLN
jgi:hypothetical protein